MGVYCRLPAVFRDRPSFCHPIRVFNLPVCNIFGFLGRIACDLRSGPQASQVLVPDRI